MKQLLNIVLLLALIVVVFSTWFLKREYTSRNAEFLPGMLVSVPYDAQSANTNFPDGKTLRTPVQNTVPEHFMPLHYRSTPEEALRAGQELYNPVSDTGIGDMQRGEEIFSTFCTPCHGAAGLGDGAVVRKGFPPPPSLLAAKAMNMKEGQMFHILTYGQGNMPSLSSQVSRLDRWRAITFVRSFQKKSLAIGK
jgi:mono/diheme cytochrome c family protein